MRTGFALLLIGTVALAGCKAETPQGPLNETQAAAAGVPADPEAVAADRWSKLFADPAKVVSTANEFGYKVDGYKPTGAAPAYRAAGVEQILPDKAAPIVVTTNFDATGAKADHIDAIDFSFEVRVDHEPKTSKQADAVRIPSRVVRGFLSRFNVGLGDQLNGALNGRRSDTATMHGVTLSVVAKPLPVGTKGSVRLDVHIAPQASAAAPQDSTARK